MQFRQNISLKEFNTFAIDVNARYFSTFSGVFELSEAIDFEPKLKKLFLGGGSNILFMDEIDGVVLKNEIHGIEIIHEDAEHIYVKVGAGENWHSFVQHCMKRNWAGVENLSLIPGNVGASPMQNIGAYGVELKEIFHSLEAFHLEEKKIWQFTNNDCEFGYRESVFKNKFKNQFVILDVTFQLNKKPIYHTGYGAIVEELGKMKIRDLSIQAISQAVINIRSSKLPDPKIIGNAGSFFKNPQISATAFKLLQENYPDIVGYPVKGNYVKLAAGWLIEQCGWKGYRSGDAGCHEKQALVLVNHGHASGKSIYELSIEILISIKEKFNVDLEREVNIFPPVKGYQL